MMITDEVRTLRNAAWTALSGLPIQVRHRVPRAVLDLMLDISTTMEMPSSELIERYLDAFEIVKRVTAEWRAAVLEIDPTLRHSPSVMDYLPAPS